MQKVFLRIILTISILFNLTFAYAHSGQEEWNPPSAEPITIWTTPLCGKGEFVVQPFFFYNRTRGTFNPKGHYDSLAGGDKKYQ